MNRNDEKTALHAIRYVAGGIPATEYGPDVLRDMYAELARRPAWKKYPVTMEDHIRNALDYIMRQKARPSGRRVWTWVIQLPDEKTMKVARMPFFAEGMMVRSQNPSGYIELHAKHHDDEAAQVFFDVRYTPKTSVTQGLYP